MLEISRVSSIRIKKYKKRAPGSLTEFPAVKNQGRWGDLDSGISKCTLEDAKTIIAAQQGSMKPIKCDNKLFGATFFINSNTKLV